jgi:UDP-N-acetylmuramate dehydrogenase
VHAEEELAQLTAFARAQGLPFIVLGNGSNVLVSDKGFEGMVLRLGGTFAEMRFEGETVTAGSGLRLAALVKACSEKALAGTEGLAGIPGTVGGALVTNAGTALGTIGEAVQQVEVLSGTGSVQRLERSVLGFGYRTSRLEGMTILRAVLHLKKHPKNDILTKINDVMLRRSNTQPIGAWNAGSVFKNPPNDSAGRLIEACGLKGLRFGEAQISEKHANFIINVKQAKAADVAERIAIADQKVKERFGIELALEIKLIGF